MSHHNFEMSPELRKAIGIDGGSDGVTGGTGRYPDGRYSEHDEGEIRFAIAADVGNQRVLIDFGKPVQSLGMTSEQALDLSDSLRKKAWELGGIV